MKVLEVTLESMNRYDEVHHLLGLLPGDNQSAGWKEGRLILTFADASKERLEKLHRHQFTARIKRDR